MEREKRRKWVSFLILVVYEWSSNVCPEDIHWSTGREGKKSPLFLTSNPSFLSLFLAPTLSLSLSFILSSEIRECRWEKRETEENVSGLHYFSS